MTPFTEFEPVRLDAAGDGACVPFCAEMGIPLAAAREAIYALAQHAGFEHFSLMEWSSADVPGAVVAGAAPLHYAVLLMGESEPDVPSGLGATPADALSDLLWSLGTPVLLDALAADLLADDELALGWLDDGADSLSASAS